MTYQHADLSSASDRLVDIDASITSPLFQQGGFQNRQRSGDDGGSARGGAVPAIALASQRNVAAVWAAAAATTANQTAGKLSIVFADAIPAFTGYPTGRRGEFTDARRADNDDSDFSPRGGLLKRLMDIAIAGTALLLLSPILLMIALAIRLTMGAGPVVFAQSRVGFGGKSFVCYKFRTMVCDGEEILRQHLERSPHAAQEWATTRKLARDPRVTTLGYVLRKSSLDELPQLVNVLLGEMSCVGPRPVVAAELSRYGTALHEYISCRPGLTGMWQISGRNNRSYADRVALDRVYARRWSLGLDLAILAATIPAVLRFGDTA